MEMEGAEVTSKDEAQRFQAAIRCAKAAVLLSTLKSLPNYRLEIPVDGQDKDLEKLRRTIRVFKVELARERLKNKRIKLCAMGEFILQVLCVIFLSAFFFVIVFQNL